MSCFALHNVIEVEFCTPLVPAATDQRKSGQGLRTCSRILQAPTGQLTEAELAEIAQRRAALALSPAGAALANQQVLKQSCHMPVIIFCLGTLFFQSNCLT